MIVGNSYAKSRVQAKPVSYSKCAASSKVSKIPLETRDELGKQARGNRIRLHNVAKRGSAISYHHQYISSGQRRELRIFRSSA